MAIDSIYRLPANENGEWWEIIDESTGVPYYYHTKSGETVWEKPDGFVIPLSVLQVRGRLTVILCLLIVDTEHCSRTPSVQVSITSRHGSSFSSSQSKERQWTQAVQVLCPEVASTITGFATQTLDLGRITTSKEVWA